MAARLIRISPRALLLAVAGSLAALSAQAQLADPTRPPAAINLREGSVVSAVPVASGLQSVILKRGLKQRPAALIHGEVVSLGGMVGESRLVKIAEDRVVLLGPSGDRETLRLTPAAEKVEKVDAGKTAKMIGMNAVKGENKK